MNHSLISLEGVSYCNSGKIHDLRVNEWFRTGLAYSAIFDGHELSSHYLTQNFYNEFTNSLDSSAVSKSLSSTYDKIHSDIFDKCSGVIVVVIDGKLYCANVGNTSAHLVVEDGEKYGFKEISTSTQLLFDQPITPVLSETTLDNKCKYVVSATFDFWNTCSLSSVLESIDQFSKEGLEPKEIVQRLGTHSMSILNDIPGNHNITIHLIKIGCDRISVPVHKSLKDITLDQSYLYLSGDHKEYCRGFGLELDLPGWVPYKLISKTLFKEKGVETLEAVESHHGQFFVWSPLFDNLHSRFYYQEKKIVVDDLEYKSIDHYYQLQKFRGQPCFELAQKLMVDDDNNIRLIGRNLELRSDWNDVRDVYMMNGLKAKFLDHELIKILDDTKGKLLVRVNSKDNYWGTGPTGTSANKLGSMLMTIRDQSPNFRCYIGRGEDRGHRPTMEDRQFISNFLNGIEQAGIFDGHGGDSTAIYLQNNFASCFDANYKLLNNIPEALKITFRNLDAHFIESKMIPGSTAVVISMTKDTIYCANVGDSEAHLVKEVDGKLETVALTKNHDCDNQDEVSRIVNMGGKVYFGRVFGTLAVTRAFGDMRYKYPHKSQNYVSAEPEISITKLDPSCKFIISASDGLWDVCTPKMSAEIVQDLLQQGETLDFIANRLISKALELGSGDNITVQIITIH